MQQNPIFLPALLLLIYAAILGLIDNFVRVIAQDSSLWQFHALRAVMVFLLLGLAARPLGLTLRPRNWRAWFARSMLHGSAMLIYFGALAFMSVAQVAAGLFTAPIFVLIFSRWLFGHDLGPLRVGATAIGFVGVLLVLQPGVNAQVGWSSLIPVLAGALYGLGSLVTREWCADESAEVLMAGMFVILGAAGFIGLGVVEIWGGAAPAGSDGFLLRGWTELSATVLWWTFVQAVGSMIAVAVMVRAYQLAEASRIAAFEYALLPIAAGWAFLLWGETIGGMALGGMCLIILSGLILSKAKQA